MSSDTTPPSAPRRTATTQLLGRSRTDDFAWMRDADDPDMATYLVAERAWYDGAAANLSELRDAIDTALVARMAPEESSVSWRQGDYLYRTEVRQGADLPQLARQIASAAWDEAGPSQVLVDLGDEAARGGSTYAELGVSEVSPDGRWLAWSVDLDGDEVYSLRFRDLESGEDLVEVAPRTYYGGAWSSDSGTFFYTVHDDAYRPHQVWRHRLGTPVSDDVLVLDEPDAHFEVTVAASRSGELVVIHLASRDTTEVWLVPAASPEEPARLVEPRRRGVEYVVEHAPWDAPDGRRDEVLVLTDDGAPEYQVVVAPTASPGREHWRPFVGHDPAVRIAGVDAFAGHVVLSLRRGGSPLLRVLARDGSSSFEIHPDEPAGTVAIGLHDEFGADAVTLALEAYHQPTVWYDVPLDGGPRRERHRREVPSYDPGRYVSSRVWITAPDGVKVPVTLVRATSTPLNGTAPCLLFGYGAYEWTYEPLFDRTLSTLLDRGVVFAHAHVRGGGEMGRAWWQQGRLLAKPTTFSDFEAAADALAHDGELGLIDGRRIVGRGGSAGGLLQGAVYSRRPDRWRAVVAEVPFVDCVNSMLDASLPLTVGEWDEWGDPHEEQYFEVMSGYAPYENLPEASARPALLVTGAVHDPRVLVHEPAKWTAALRASDPRRGVGVDPDDPTSPGTVLFRCETGEGSHGGPAGRFSSLRHEAEIQAWILHAMGVRD